MSQFESRIYMGRENGVKSYIYFGLLSKESLGPLPILVRFSDDTKAILSSFFLGMFGSDIRRMGSKIAFYQHYQFTGSETILKSIDEYVDIALRIT